jgi:hypothetical protein
MGRGRLQAVTELWNIARERHRASEPIRNVFLNTAEGAARMAAEVNQPNFRDLFDTFHANVEEKSIAAGLRTAGPYLKHLHSCENDRGIPGTGHVDWMGVFQALRDMRYDGWVTIESFGFALGELSAAASIWRDFPSPMPSRRRRQVFPEEAPGVSRWRSCVDRFSFCAGGRGAMAAALARIVLVGGKPSHGHGEHEHNAGVSLLANFLNQNKACRQWRCATDGRMTLLFDGPGASF